MFIKARLKLTGWYLLIIMMISLAFSGVIYRTSKYELERFADAQMSRYERKILIPNSSIEYLAKINLALDQELIDETNARILGSLLIINLGILGIAGVLGYYLSGKTLSPIQDMMDEQYRFISDASHELKTPITAIKTTIEVAMRDKQLKIGEARQTLKDSLDEVNRLQTLAEGLLELNDKNITTSLIPTNLKDVINTAIKMIQPIATEKNVDIGVHLSNIIAKIDEQSMVRAFVALIDNAVKYSPHNKMVSINAYVKNKLIIVEIIDKGVGIKKQDLPLVFDRLYRADQSRSTKGHGIGLSIAKQIIESNNGHIRISSKYGESTKVYITLPFSTRIQNSMKK